VTAQQLQLLTDLCRKVPAGEGNAGSYSSSSSLLVPGVLSLESSEQAEMLLQDLMRISRALVQHARRLNTMVSAWAGWLPQTSQNLLSLPEAALAAQPVPYQAQNSTTKIYVD
jgi:hypothetical protein